MNIKKIIRELSLKRPFFYSEDDLKFALAWAINEYYRARKFTELETHLERGFDFEDGSNVRIDIVVSIKDTIFPFELKYKKKGQMAQDGGRYKFLKDISRIEHIVELYNCTGYAILLTDDHLYWNKSDRNTIDKEFHIHKGRILEGVMKWKKPSFALKMDEYKEPIELKGTYEVKWRDYSPDFRYLLIEVKEN